MLGLMKIQCWIRLITVGKSVAKDNKQIYFLNLGSFGVCMTQNVFAAFVIVTQMPALFKRFSTSRLQVMDVGL
jgi:hypothetical protein